MTLTEWLNLCLKGNFLKEVSYQTMTMKINQGGNKLLVQTLFTSLVYGSKL